MAISVSEIMNHELFSVRSGDHAGEALQHLLALGITGAPVLDRDGRLIGFASIRDLADAPPRAGVLTRMSVPVETIGERATIRSAAERIADSGRQHLVVTDDDGRAVGLVSSIDVIRGMIGRPAPHPNAFPHFDPRSGAVWSNDQQLTFAAVKDLPDDPGLFVLIDAQEGRANRIVWSEGTDNLRVRLRDLIATPAGAPAHLIDAAVCGRLWFRWASTGTKSALTASARQ